MNKYPREIDPLMNDKSSLTASCEFYPIKEIDENTKPLSIHEGYSRAVLTILDYSNPSKVQSVTANIPAKRGVYMLEKRVKAAYEKCLSYEFEPQKEVVQTTNGNTANPAYTIKLSGGKLKGKTPAAAMLENPANRQALVEQFEFLKKNLEKYPRNKEQMIAIKNAIDLYEAGALEGDQIQDDRNDATEFVVFEVPIKIPNAEKKDANGKTKIYSIKITCNPSNKYPFAIEIMNAVAEVRKKGNLINVDYQTAEDRLSITHRAKADDFMGFIADLANKLRQFDDIFAPVMWKQASKLSYRPQSQIN